jgi:hypothetical protein
VRRRGIRSHYVNHTSRNWADDTDDPVPNWRSETTSGRIIRLQFAKGWSAGESRWFVVRGA